jgi:hypothetical protein
MAQYNRALTGDVALDLTLRALQINSANRVAKAALWPAVRMVGQAIRAVAPRGKTGNLKRSIGWKNYMSRRTGWSEAKAGVNVGKQSKARKGRTAPHSHLVALGVPMRIGARGRKRIGGMFSFIKNPTVHQLRTGEQAPNPFVRVGYAAVAGAIPWVMRTAAARQLIIEAARSRRKP